MTLEELNSKCFSMPGHIPPVRLYVFTDEDSADEWIEGKIGYELVMVLQSDMVAHYTLKEEWRKAEVQHFYAVGEDELVVVIEEPERKMQKPDGEIQVGDVVKLAEEQDDPTALLEQEPCNDWYDVPSDEMTLEQARQAVKDLRKKLAEYLEQEPILDKIRAEIEQTAKDYGKFDNYRRVRGLWIALEIIDKYKEGVTSDRVELQAERAEEPV